MENSDHKIAVRGVDVAKHFGQGAQTVRALDGVSVEIRDNEFFTLLGPSGCGKTTLLRLIAGFELATEGEIFLFEEEIEDLPPHKRSINTVFQHYALFPHMTVGENVGFGLRMLKRDEADIERRVKDTLALVKMEHFINRKPAQMSGGQQQRVALARALAPQPKVLLLDEPLSALDLKLRQQMRMELKNLQRETGITFIFVTHDQEEALTMSDRIAVMSAGKIQQIGSPHDIYERPVNRFVADFIGDSNFLEAEIESLDNEMATCRVSSELKLKVQSLGERKSGDKVTLAIRPEKIHLGDQGNASGEITTSIYLGTDTSYSIRISDVAELSVRDQNALSGVARFSQGQTVKVDIPESAVRMLQD
ncbi:MAG: spermidine/putrescine transport system ATP-binding protein [Parasphingorhabdus sp.]